MGGGQGGPQQAKQLRHLIMLGTKTGAKDETSRPLRLTGMLSYSQYCIFAYKGIRKEKHLKRILYDLNSRVHGKLSKKAIIIE